MRALSAAASLVLAAVAVTGCTHILGGDHDYHCHSPLVLCGSKCVDESSDTANCGACGHACGAGETCCSDQCTAIDTDASNCGSCGTQCAPGQSCCAKTCQDLMAQHDNCGTCGNQCGKTEECCMGTCSDPLTDSANCGGCGSPCVPGLWCCRGSCLDLESNSDCGTCGNACQGGGQCCSGKCVPKSGDAGACNGCAPCDATTPDCCDKCTNVQTDPLNCGACKNSCTALGSGYGCCPGGAGPHCANLGNDAQNCGACGTTCTLGCCADSMGGVGHCDGTRITYGSSWIPAPNHPTHSDTVVGTFVDWDGDCLVDGPNSKAVLSNGFQPIFQGADHCHIGLGHLCPTAPCSTRIWYAPNWIGNPHPGQNYDDWNMGVVTWNGICTNSGSNSFAKLSNGWKPYFSGNNACHTSFRYENCDGVY